MSFEERVHEVVDPELRDIRQMFQHSEPTSNGPLTDDQIESLLNRNLQREAKNEINWVENANPFAKHPDEAKQDPEPTDEQQDAVSIIEHMKALVDDPDDDETSQEIWNFLQELEDTSYDPENRKLRGPFGKAWDFVQDFRAFKGGGVAGLLGHIFSRGVRRGLWDTFWHFLPSLNAIITLNKSIWNAANRVNDNIVKTFNTLFNDPEEGFQRMRQQIRGINDFYKEKLIHDPSGNGGSMMEMMEKCCSETSSKLDANALCCQTVSNKIDMLGKPSSLQNLEVISKLDDLIGDTSVIRGLL